MTIRESYAVLALQEGDDIDLVKRAYRKLAFELHPDMHPDTSGAAVRFQRLNEAYVFLSRHLATSSGSQQETSHNQTYSEKKIKDAEKAYAKTKAEQTASSRKSQEEVLSDILKDPFARRVYEDIYRETHQGSVPRENKRTSVKENTSTLIWAEGENFSFQNSGRSVLTRVKKWFTGLIDEEQVLRLPKASLVPGAKVRLEIQHGLSGASQAIEIVLPPEFVPGKAVRLKGMGKRLGTLAGDLFVKIEAL